MFALLEFSENMVSAMTDLPVLAFEVKVGVPQTCENHLEEMEL